LRDLCADLRVDPLELARPGSRLFPPGRGNADSAQGRGAGVAFDAGPDPAKPKSLDE
jgi:hypothetical protein